MLSIGDGIPDNILQKDLEDTASFFVDETGDTFDTTTTCETTNSLGDEQSKNAYGYNTKIDSRVS